MQLSNDALDTHLIKSENFFSGHVRDEPGSDSVNKMIIM